MPQEQNQPIDGAAETAKTDPFKSVSDQLLAEMLRKLDASPDDVTGFGIVFEYGFRSAIGQIVTALESLHASGIQEVGALILAEGIKATEVPDFAGIKKEASANG